MQLLPFADTKALAIWDTFERGGLPAARFAIALTQHETHELDVARRLQPSGDHLCAIRLAQKGHER